MSLVWVGTRTDSYEQTVGFFRDVLGLGLEGAAEGFTVLSVAGGATVEVFGPDSPYNRHLSHPVAGFRVVDLDVAADKLVAADAEIVLPIQRAESRAWLHFRAPDGYVYELVQDDAA